MNIERSSPLPPPKLVIHGLPTLRGGWVEAAFMEPANVRGRAQQIMGKAVTYRGQPGIVRAWNGTSYKFAYTNGRGDVLDAKAIWVNPADVAEIKIGE